MTVSGPYLSGNPSNPLQGVPAGAGAGILRPSGNLVGSVIASSTGSSPANTAGDYVVAVFSLPAYTFDNAGRTVWIEAAGSFAANVNNKRIKLIVNPSAAVVGSTVTGGTTICDTGTVTTSGGGWFLAGSVVKYGAGGANTQLGIHQQALVGSASSALLAPSAITATESGAILVAVTANAGTTATDIVFNFMAVTMSN